MDEVIKQLYDVLKDLEWAGNLTDDDESWGVITIACPSCRNAKKNGHKVNCKLNEALKTRKDLIS